MKFVKERLWLKGDLLIMGVALLAALGGIMLKKQVVVSDTAFMLGLVLLCIMMIDILLHANLLAGWFQKQRKGESDEEFAKRKIDVKRVASEKKNGPIHFERLALNCLVLGGYLIILAVVITL
ncbi:DUF3899 domain-containing protein [Ligilactobacillus apodemi]|uniref:DUF3899 domain-containing protein n=1 Tax=Ligilactobacillus apodemi DSM 16634 = JCM 16172 TaxID=1423724 RepID=A0A0R1TX48_9LACO|nr:DUF3899 domain-containing protein [Ligilactobacillus apodemi]KRL83352.1 hypothetical protein FC32_GL000602 [Ligilactobacillus apodemi DSM 16634 = JCM 16172]MCR1901507.1 DUF3899 domain-containing protein [Ligilactobacillus apodemi]